MQIKLQYSRLENEKSVTGQTGLKKQRLPIIQAYIRSITRRYLTQNLQVLAYYKIKEDAFRDYINIFTLII